ncbi:MAG: LLM class flavin-dependent oxidoreductase [Candidatus Heimdallarchaeota archaeon]|nr:MAG: LLM class flavin-dependent oxidoreductase [Candidatus Heimdallarchaeota archaeon]
MKPQKNLGITLSYDFIPPTLCNDLLRVLDDSNFTHLFVPEIWGRDAFTQIASMANHTSNLILGTGIVNLYSRTPATLAQTAAGLHELTDGKFILGLGLSGPIVIQDWHGVDFYHPSPLQRTREYLEIVRLIFSGERVNYSGQLFSLKNFKLNYDTPVEIPLFLAAIGPRNVQLAGELADGWLPIWTSFTLSPKPKKDLEKGLAQRSPKLRTSFDIAPYVITVASDSEKARKLVQKHLAYYIGSMGTFYYQNMKRLGFTTEADRIKIAWNAGDREIAALSVSQTMVEKVAILGKPEDIVTRYQELHKSGVNLPVVMPPFGCPPDLAMETIAAFSEL